jgi:hypothetical protein
MKDQSSLKIDARPPPAFAIACLLVPAAPAVDQSSA